ncbi:hypothetical protein ABID50_001912 [Streptococcus parasuis]|uniref:Uncharacterized protein n=1 Tax=Streptococcus parasuis TaxID=1501662 RepID=A0ABV2EVB2_9STRE
MVNLVGVLEPLGTSFVFNDLVDRAAHVNIYDISLGVGLDEVGSPFQSFGIATKELDRHRVFVVVNMEHMEGLLVVVEKAFFRDHFHNDQTCAHFLGNGAEGRVGHASHRS